MTESFKTYRFSGMGLDPIHVGTGGSRLGRVDNTIVRDPVTRIPKIPGSSLAGVMRTYTAMYKEKYPECAGLGGHCGKTNCRVCTVFGSVKNDSKTRAGLAAFSDMHLMLFPVASGSGPHWITCPAALWQAGIFDSSKLDDSDSLEQYAVYCKKDGKNTRKQLKLGWLFLPVKTDYQELENIIETKELKIPDYITKRLGLVSDKLFTHIVNSNLEVRTSVAIDPTTGSAEEGALFTYEALPVSTVLVWEITCRNPKHFYDKNQKKAVESSEDVKNAVAEGFPYLENLGIGGMGNRGMGRIRVLNK